MCVADVPEGPLVHAFFAGSSDGRTRLEPIRRCVIFVIANFLCRVHSFCSLVPVLLCCQVTPMATTPSASQPQGGFCTSYWKCRGRCRPTSSLPHPLRTLFRCQAMCLRTGRAVTLTAQVHNTCSGTLGSTRSSKAFRWATAPRCVPNWGVGATRTTTPAAGVVSGVPR